MSNLDKAQEVPQPECLDNYGIAPCTAEYLEQMRNVTRQCNYDVKSFFEQHDPLEFGTVSDFIFKCVMHEKYVCQTGFSMRQVQLITDFFRMPDGAVCYQRFVALMNSTENIAQQLRECASKVPFPIISEAPLRHCGKRVFGTEPCVPSILERMRSAYFRLRFKLTDKFRCCDPQCTGIVTEDKFRCIMAEIQEEAAVTDRQMDALVNYYRCCGDKIGYKRMADMFDSTLSLQEQIQLNYITKKDQLLKPKAVNTLSEEEEKKLQDILYKIVACADRHILTTLSAHFDKFAHRQSGETTIPHLHRFFNYIGTTLTGCEFKLIAKKYATNDYNVNFLQLVEDLDDTFHDRICPQPPPPPILGADGPPYDLEYAPMGDGAGKNSSVWGHGVCQCTSEDEHALGKCLPPDSTRFYETGPVCGGSGVPPVWGKQYVKKGVGALPGQRYAGAYALSPPAGVGSGLPTGTANETSPKPGESEAVEIRNLMERMQQYIYRFRIRTKDFFLPFDKLNTGTVTANRFRRALCNMGMGSYGRVTFTEAEFDAIINYYRMEHDPSLACWRKFDADIESIFIQKGIEQLPSLLTPSPKAIVELPNPGATNMEDIPLRIRQLANCAVARLKHRILIESCNFKYFLTGFDRYNNGHISRQQFKQTLSMLNYEFTAEELEAMSVKYCDHRGFNYLKLLDDIEPKKEELGWYAKYKAGRLYQLNRPPMEPKWQEHDIQRIMYKLMAKMVRYRPKLQDFLQDHDWHNHDRIKIIDFHRALDRAGFQLTPREVEVLTCCYTSQHDPTEIEWRCFMEAVESVFTLNHLDYAPRIVPQAWRPIREMDYDKELTKEEFCLLQSGLRRLAKRVYDRRIEFKPMFEDFDKPQAGLVSENQFHRVLHTLGLADITTPSELDAIFKRFQVIRGGQKDIDYVEFLYRLEGITCIDPITLEEQSPTGVEWVKERHPYLC